MANGLLLILLLGCLVGLLFVSVSGKFFDWILRAEKETEWKIPFWLDVFLFFVPGSAVSSFMIAMFIVVRSIRDDRTQFSTAIVSVAILFGLAAWALGYLAYYTKWSIVRDRAHSRTQDTGFMEIAMVVYSINLLIVAVGVAICYTIMYLR